MGKMKLHGGGVAIHQVILTKVPLFVVARKHTQCCSNGRVAGSSGRVGLWPSGSLLSM